MTRLWAERYKRGGKRTLRAGFAFGALYFPGDRADFFAQARSIGFCFCWSGRYARYMKLWWRDKGFCLDFRRLKVEALPKFLVRHLDRGVE